MMSNPWYIKMKERHMPFLIFLTTINLLFCPKMFAQVNVNASGGNGNGTGGKVSYSVGQLGPLSKAGAPINVSPGVQQPIEISTITTSLHSLNKELVINLSPNPSSESITISFNVKPEGETCYRLFDLNGKLLTQGTINHLNTAININHLSSSTYILKVFEQNTEIKAFKLIKK